MYTGNKKDDRVSVHRKQQLYKGKCTQETTRMYGYAYVQRKQQGCTGKCTEETPRVIGLVYTGNNKGDRVSVHRKQKG